MLSIAAGSTPPSGGIQQCFDENTRGEASGSCGHDATNYLACAAA